MRLIENDGGRQKDYSEVRARQRLNELSRLVRYRRDHGLDIGHGVAWSIVLSDIALARRHLWTKGREGEFAPGAPLVEQLRHQIDNLFWRIGLGDIVNSPLMRAIHAEVWPRLSEDPHVLLPAAGVGEVLEVTAIERADCRLLTIDDVEEGAHGRRLKAAREREQRKRLERGAKPRSQSLSATRPWKSLGISRATYYRRLRAETDELR